MPNEDKQKLIRVFSKLKERVLWKSDDTTLQVPSNVLLKKFFPQQDLLGMKQASDLLTQTQILI
jgi:glucuronosyltransferase